MCRRKRSRPSSRRRLTKKVYWASVGSFGWDSAIGVVEEVRLITKPPVAAPAEGRVRVFTTKSGFALMTCQFPGNILESASLPGRGLFPLTLECANRCIYGQRTN